MGLIMAFLLIASVSTTFLWISKNDQDYLTQQQKLREQDQKQFLLIKDMLRSRVESWFEAFVHFQASYADTAEATAFFLEHEFEYLRVNWQINGLWLLDGELNTIFSTTTTTPAYVITDATEVIKLQTSSSNTRCIKECEQLISMPILMNSSDVLVLSISSSLLEAMAALNQTTFADLAIVSVPEQSQTKVKVSELLINSPISSANKLFMQQILQQVPAQLSVATLKASGYRLTSANKDLLLNLLPVDPEFENRLFLLTVHDITSASKAHAEYRANVLIISLLVVLFCSLAIWFLSMQFRRRLLVVTKMLPLLAQKNYSEFHQQKMINSNFFADEIEILHDTASLLGHELENLDRTIEQNTRELETIALYDQLTGLPNRNRLNQLLIPLLQSINDNTDRLAIIFLDFDKFRKINDSYGHDIGDAFLIQAANNIRSCLQSSDLLFRLGGDEFVIVFKDSADKNRALTLANSLVSYFQQALKVGERYFYSSCSIGVASANSAQNVVDEIIRQSDIAMNAAKDAGGNRVCEFNHEMLSKALRRIEIENEVRAAFKNDEFSFALQAQVEIATGKLVGFEALIRWIHPQRGFVSPDEFIPIIENSESMIDLGYWGLKRAFIILEKLDEIGFSGLKVAVNLSASQFLDPQLIPFLKEQLVAFSRDAEQIELELTERTVVADIEQTLDTMQQLRTLGFTFSIDDFGTGYSSLAYLKQMPVEIIKIDRSFISGMQDDNADMKIVSSTIAMVNKLGMQVVAEGIETAEQLQMLATMQCEIGQGYFISRPVSEKDLYDLLPLKVSNGIWIDLSKTEN
ncbi:diguanylate phosphodiesterase [Paraglaciecola hydrolytica]|uniref:Diguanylate phosphodiesterase n=2 Tax=Paraglaciecola hydrolytica TaxID=1799789 RepID=A0A136A5L1_9ALTE|nr:diguanylate phosphodiesterase [Paraglaciecola hydrolytica]